MPARLRDIIEMCNHFGVTVEPPKASSHWQAKKDGCRTFTIPAHNGERTEISDRYIRSLCRNFGLGSVLLGHRELGVPRPPLDAQQLVAVLRHVRQVLCP
jgi:hypothetical protein